MDDGSAELDRWIEPGRTVAIGASAGGLDACSKLLADLPPDTGMAFVVVLHLDPTHESHLAELLAKTTPMPVVEVSSKMRLQGDHVYVIVPDTALDLQDGILIPSQREAGRGVVKPINGLFAALARDRRENAIAVVLSGSGDDGAAGLEAVEAAGGVCLVQEPESADFDGMPRSAIATGYVDQVLQLFEIGPVLAELAGDSRPAAPEEPDSASGKSDTEHRVEVAPGSQGFNDILSLVASRFGLDFAHYRHGTLCRRISRRMSMKHVSEAADYVAILDQDPQELEALFYDLLIDVTQFFRDPEVWELLGGEILPQLVADADEDATLRFWVPACSSGEEAYTLAILVLEAMRASERSLNVQIFATDVNQRAIEVARRGFYPGTIADQIDDALLARYFSRQGEHYQIASRVRDTITFAVHDLVADPPFSRMNLVSCRNLLIYLEPKAQRRALELMTYALAPGGYLVLGSAESVDRRGDDFEVISDVLRVYKSKDAAEQSQRQIPRWMSNRSPLSRDSVPRPAPSSGGGGGKSAERHLERYILSRHASAAVAINGDFDILHFFGPTDDYLVAPTGEVQLDLLAWVRPGLYARLQPALERAVEADEPVEVEGMYVERGEQTGTVACRIEPLASVPGAEGMYLVTFRDLPVQVEVGEQSEEERSQIRKLETQLRATRSEQRQLRERLENRSEQYQAHHEELLSLNEELQSTNEELETSKEELQSLNEEMITVNRELEEKNAELGELNTDLNNLLLSTDIPTIFLDEDLHVRRFTPASTQVMRLVPSDIGRSVEHVKERFDSRHLLDAAHQVLAGEGPVQTEVQTDEGRYYTERILPYRTDEGSIGGVCITFSDITEQKEKAAEIELARQYSEAIVRTIRTPLLVLDADLRIVSINLCFHQTFETSEEGSVGQRIFEFDCRRWDIPGLRALLEKVLPEQVEVTDYALDHEFEHLGQRYLQLNASTMERPQGEPLILLSIEDITARKMAELEAKTRADELAREHERKDEFLAMLGHELRNPLAALSCGLKYQDDTDGGDESTREMMARQLSRMKLMLDQLLEMSRVASGKIVLERTPVDLAEASRHALEVVESLSGWHDKRLSCSLQPPRQAVVMGDSHRLEQVIENLLTNAAKYTDPDDSIELTLETDADNAILRVRDSGVGIEPDLLPHIFELFTQASQTLQRSEGGLGLGLSLAHKLIEMHHGRLDAYSDGHGKGCEFVITLTLDEETKEEVGEPPKLRRRRPVQPRRILVVDDEEDVAEMFGVILQRDGYETRTVGDGASAIKAAREFAPDVILVDIGLPVMSGYEVARRLREELGDKPLLVAVTGYREDLEKLEEAGFDKHLIKPPDFDELSDWLAGLE